MTRDLPPDQEPPEGPPEPPAGRVRTTSAGVLTGFGLTGFVLGWLLRPVSIRVQDTAPTVGWGPVLGLLLAAVILGAVAWSTYRSLHPRRPRHPRAPARRDVLDPHRAVNRLVLAKSSALSGALVGGGYLGYALSWWGIGETALARDRLVQSLLAGVAGLLVVTASLLLERACRVGGEDDADLR